MKWQLVFKTVLVIPSVGVAASSSSPWISRLSKRQWTIGQTVQTSSGPVQGHPAPGASEVSEYLGIPYAVPPVGNLRFQPPSKHTGTSTINGTNFGFGCMTKGRGIIGNSTTSVKRRGATAVGLLLLEELSDSDLPKSEDCLTLNVWTKPQTGEAEKAVMVWIHGGGFTSGSSAQPWHRGQHLADQEDVVVVSINYRLNIFGFPGNPTTRANLGLLDQRLAVEWVRDNIAGFHGDPARITLFGESAGGSSVDYYSYAWASDPIVAGFIVQSGTATGFGQMGNATANQLWLTTAQRVGCPIIGASQDAILTCMRGKSAADIIAALPDTGLGITGGLPFGPVVDNLVVFSDYGARTPAPLPMLVGNTDNEAGLFRLAATVGQPAVAGFVINSLGDEVWTALNDRAFVCPAALRASRSVAAGNPTWRYRYFGSWPNLQISTDPDSGAWHGSEIPVLFDTAPSRVVPATAEQVAFGKYMRSAWAAFAKDPAKGLSTFRGEGGPWPRYSTTNNTLVRLAFENKTGPNLAPGNAYDASCKGIPTVVSPQDNESSTGEQNAGVKLGASWLAMAVFAAAAWML